LKYFEQLYSDPDCPVKGEALFNVGRLYAEIGETEKSMSAFRKIGEEHSDSIYNNLVKLKADSLGSLKN